MKCRNIQSAGGQKKISEELFASIDQTEIKWLLKSGSIYDLSYTSLFNPLIQLSSLEFSSNAQHRTSLRHFLSYTLLATWDWSPSKNKQHLHLINSWLLRQHLIPAIQQTLAKI